MRRLDPRLIEVALAQSVQEAHLATSPGQGLVVLADGKEIGRTNQLTQLKASLP